MHTVGQWVRIRNVALWRGGAGSQGGDEQGQGAGPGGIEGQRGGGQWQVLVTPKSRISAFDAVANNVEARAYQAWPSTTPDRIL